MSKIIILNLMVVFLGVNLKGQAVGIGTSTPSDALHIIGATNDDALRVQVGTATKLRVLNNGGTTLGTNNTSGTPANGLFVFGNTGLGVNNPTEKLEINGNLNLSGELKPNGVTGEEGQLLASNGNGTMTWVDPCKYEFFKDFFNTDANPQKWIVPANTTEIMVEMWGAGGGGSSNYGGGGGGYIKFVREVIPGDTILFDLGIGGNGASAGGNATGGTNTTFPISSYSNLLNYAEGGSSGETGYGGTYSINLSNVSRVRLRGQNGKPQKMSFYQISSTHFAQKIEYGDGGTSGYDQVLSGHGGIIVQNTTNNSNLYNSHGRFGGQPGGGGGGGAGTSQNSGGPGGDGYVIIHW